MAGCTEGRTRYIGTSLKHRQRIQKLFIVDPLVYQKDPFTDERPLRYVPGNPENMRPSAALMSWENLSEKPKQLAEITAP